MKDRHIGHANLFIPSTLNGSCLTSSGGVDQNMLRKNLESAINVYISRVDGAPYASTEIHLYKGVDSAKYQEENEVIKVFLKGSKAAKSKIETEKPELYSLVKETWDSVGSISEKMSQVNMFLCFSVVLRTTASKNLRMRHGILVAPVLLLCPYLFQILRTHSMVATVETMELIIAMDIT